MNALSEALAAIEIESPDSCVWLGQRRRVDVRAPRDDAAGRLRSWLADRLYADFYCTGGIAPPEDDRPDDSSTSLADALSEANAGRGSAQGGWNVLGQDGDSLVLERDGLHVWADPGEVLATDPRPGFRVGLLCPKETRGLPDGFYSAYGDAGDGVDSGGSIDRHYWSVRPEGRALTVALITTRLNEAEIPFRYKTLNSPLRERCDAGVLYTPVHVRRSVAQLLPPIHAEVHPHLRPHVPAFTLPLAPGLGFAEHPPGDLSFGEHRCRIVAEALLEAFETGIVEARDREAAVGRHWEAQGLSLAQPHLNPGSRVDDDPPPIAP